MSIHAWEPTLHAGVPFCALPEIQSMELQELQRIFSARFPGSTALHCSSAPGRVNLIGGHTDASGSRIYNLKLSEQRADTGRSFLLKHYPIESNRLISIGFGEERLRDSNNPDGAINRRVEISNIGKR